jgi:hypothetical protein
LRISKSLGYVVVVHTAGLIQRFVIIIVFISQGREKKKEEKT